MRVLVPGLGRGDGAEAGRGDQLGVPGAGRIAEQPALPGDRPHSGN